MSLQLDSHVSRLVSQENGEEKMMTATSGMKLLELLPKQNQNGLLEKMLKALLTSPMVESCNRYNKIWKKRVSKSNVLLFQLQVSVLGIKEKESGLSDVMYPTPNTQDYKTNPGEDLENWKKRAKEKKKKGINLHFALRQAVQMYPTPTAMDHIDRKGMRPSRAATNRKSGYLSEMIKMYPTPTQGMWKQDVNDNGEYAKRVKEKGHQVMLPTFVKLYPTPRACDMEGGVVKNVEIKDGTFSRVNKKGVRFGVKLKDAVHKLYPTPTNSEHKYRLKGNTQASKCLEAQARKAGGRLNPNFVEFLMAYPKDWTKIEPIE